MKSKLESSSSHHISESNTKTLRQGSGHYSPPGSKDCEDIFLSNSYKTKWTALKSDSYSILLILCKIVLNINIFTFHQFLPPNHVIGSRARFEFQALEPGFMNRGASTSLRAREDSQRKKFFEKFRWERRPSDKHREFIDILQFPKGNK